MKYACADCGREGDEPNGPCPDCGSYRIVSIETIEEIFGKDWRDSFKPEVES